jgi:hypothetical protein
LILQGLVKENTKEEEKGGGGEAEINEATKPF